MAPAANIDLIKPLEKADNVPDYVDIVPISDEERDRGFNVRETLQKCMSHQQTPLVAKSDMEDLQLKYFHRGGMVVISNAILETLVDKMKDEIIEESKALQDREEVHFHQGKAT